ncbi:MAG: hypothetical protein A3G18_03165 [Rhodospirillales bacterium RIFCSPLOWO2_12_FULL_58_28]|nr:MAG: hypothetical protein A3H92_06390 [Rhodospirillales bacterium RIFCSPLOWO2_02_FULL_58_16]OHC77227.1 MAG: hypothetical protein A3G18_03165 [Rhodospirillales bacterium RIFCSPLOWO2_12_FULL_58_28]
MLSNLRNRSSIENAIAEFDKIGREAFLAKYGFREARFYFLKFNGRLYDSKAIVGAGMFHETGTQLLAGEFNGGKATVQRKLEELEFEVVFRP